MNRHVMAARTAPIDGSGSRRARSAVTLVAGGGTNGSGASPLRRSGLSLISLSVALVAISMAFLAASSSAAITHNLESFSPIDGSGSGPVFDEPQGIAIDEATGNLFVTDGTRIAILGAEGGIPVGIAAPHEVPGIPFGENSQAGLAYDNSATSPARGTLYAFNPGTQAVQGYARNGASERYELSGAEIPVPQAFIIGLSVDTAGNLYISNIGTQTIRKYSPLRALVTEYDLSTSSSGASGQSVVDSAGDLFVGDQNLGLFKFPVNGTGEIDPDVYTRLSSKHTTGITIDPTTEHIYAAFDESVGEFVAPAGSLLDEFGSGVVRGTGRIAVNASTEQIYAVNNGTQGNGVINVFGPGVTVPTLGLSPASGITGTKATLIGSVNPIGLEVEECFFEWGKDENGKPNYDHKTSCEGTIGEDSATYPVSAQISDLTSNGATYHYRLVAINENGTERTADRSFETGPTVTTQSPTGVGQKTATLNGAVRPEGLQYTNCTFEYGLTTSASFEKSAPCNPPAGSIGADFESHAVSADLTSLSPNAAYKFRLTATNAAGTLSGQTLIFTTVGPPQITEVRALNASQGTANLEGKINPSGFGTSYRFEWGATSSYGNQVPADFEPFVGSGSEPVRVGAKLNGLSAGQTYHYRIVASSSAGTTASPDQIVETLNSCGLPEGRCFELVSRKEVGPVAIPGETFSPMELHFQAATSPGALAYVVEAGYPDATKAGEVLYRGTRGSSGWDSTQISSPIVALNEQGGVGSVSSNTQFLSNDLSCGFLESSQPLTDDPSTRLVIENGGSNLYRNNPDGSYTAVSKLAPEDSGFEFEAGRNNYTVLDAAEDCSRVLFRSIYHYPGIAASGLGPLYEWDEGALRNVGVVPGPSGGEVVVEADGPIAQGQVSEGGSRLFFSAKRQTSPNPEEIGKEAVFVREDSGATVRDVSLSQTGTPDKGATYQWATPDGSHVFFTANAGLTEESSSGGTDLYEYNLETDELIDRSASQVDGGAQVAGFVGAAGDGSEVYFVSRAQLVPGRGNTQAENESANTYSIYGESDGAFSFVGKIRGFDLGRATIGLYESARVSPDGRYLLFPSTANVTGYEGGGSVQAYLYDAHGGSEGTICISCRQDGQPSIAQGGNEPYEVLAEYQSANSPLHPLQFLVMHDGEPRVFFSSPDSLAPGAVEGQNNVYEWAHGQLFRLASAVEGQQGRLYSGYGTAFAGASDDGSDIYFFTPQTLNWEDGDERFSVYDARMGGGFPQPPVPPAPCNADAEGSCQGAPQGGPAVPGAASATFSGPGNEKQTQARKKKKAHKKSKRHAKKKGKQARHENGNGRTGK